MRATVEREAGAWRTPPTIERRLRGSSRRHAGPGRLAGAAPSLRTVGAVRVAAHRGSRRARRRCHALRVRRLADRRPAVLGGAARLGGGPGRGPEGVRVPPHLGALRARRRVRPHPQQLRLPAVDLQRAGVHARADHDPRLLLAGHRGRVREVRPPRCLHRHQRRRSPPPTHLPGHHPPRDRHGRVRAAAKAPTATCCSSAESIPTRGLRMPSRSPAGPTCHW